jgi:acetolactate synthase-1/2/3 large subunit
MAQHFSVLSPKTFLTSGGLGTMGFGLPAAIGAALAHPSRKVICVSGDGSILMNIQELATLAELDLDVTLIIFNNGQLGLVRQQQEFFYKSNFIASSFTHRPDFAKIASGFGIRGISIDEFSFNSLGDILAQKGPCLIDARIDSYSNVLPMVPPNAANIDPIETHESHGTRSEKIIRRSYLLAAHRVGKSSIAKN